jgi:hypothetical protein
MFSVIDAVMLGIYLFELVIKLFVWRGAYFKSGWNIFGQSWRWQADRCATR